MSVHHLDPVWAGEAVTLRIGPVTLADGSAVDLSAASAIELEVKARAGDADPATISKTLASGIALFGTTHIDVSLVPNDTKDMAGPYTYDVIAVLGGNRRLVVHPSRFFVRPIVNRP